MSLPTLLTSVEVASYLKLKNPERTGVKTVEKWARTGRLKGIAIKVGDYWRFREDRVERLIEQGGIRR
jgi:excisionase family DNA binding protein